MNADVLATVLTGVGVLIGVWRIVTVQVDSVRRDLTAQIAAVDNKLSAAIRDVNTRIENVLLADRKPTS
ncbi:MAG: hypothetical protein OXH75_25005 [Acidobacteria bacterium]|nr:hypothetical protein [Acidobacteriota bacterium]